MYELIILAHLMRMPAHGYLIVKILNGVIGPYARISSGRLYPLLAKLEKSGLIALQNSPNTATADRQLRVYTITETGRKRFIELMMDTSSNPGDYQKLFWQKVCFFEYLQPAQCLRLVDHYLNYCQAHLLHLRAEGEDFAYEAPTWGPAWTNKGIQSVLNVMHHSAQQWELEYRWATELREQILKEIGARVHNEGAHFPQDALNPNQLP